MGVRNWVLKVGSVRFFFLFVILPETKIPKTPPKTAFTVTPLSEVPQIPLRGLCDFSPSLSLFHFHLRP